MSRCETNVPSRAAPTAVLHILRLVLAAGIAVWLWMAFGMEAVGKPGKKGGGNTEVRLARILFVDSPGIRWDGASSCVDPVLGETWDYWHYWDYRDPVLTLDPACEPCRIDVSGGGRVKFFTATAFERWLTLDFRPNPDFPHPAPYMDPAGNGPGIDTQVYPGTTNAPPTIADTFVDNVKGTINLDSMFKKNVTRHRLDLTIRRQQDGATGWGPAGWSLHSIVDLHIVDDPQDNDVRVLTTRNPQTGEQDAAFFELWQNGETVGVYYFPLTWEMRLIAAP